MIKQNFSKEMIQVKVKKNALFLLLFYSHSKSKKKTQKTNNYQVKSEIPLHFIN